MNLSQMGNWQKLFEKRDWAALQSSSVLLDEIFYLDDRTCNPADAVLAELVPNSTVGYPYDVYDMTDHIKVTCNKRLYRILRDTR